MVVHILKMTININDVPATKITGLKTIAKKLDKLKKLKIGPTHLLSPLISKHLARIKKGDHIINIHKSPTLMTFATNKSSSHIVKKKSKKNLSVNCKVIWTASVLELVSIHCWNWKIPIHRKINGPLIEL